MTAYALRVSVDGRTLVYSGDTARCDALTEQAKGADVFLCEASFLSGHDEPDRHPPDRGRGRRGGRRGRGRRGCC